MTTSIANLPVSEPESHSFPWLGAIVLAPLYILATWAGLHSVLTTPGIAVIWPSTGIAIGGLLILPRRYWWAVVPSLALMSAMVFDFATPLPFQSIITYAIANALEPLSAGLLVHRLVSRKPDLSRMSDLVKLLGIGVSVALVFTSVKGAILPVNTIGTGTLGTWFAWWIASATGIVLMTPTILAWSSPELSSRLRLQGLRIVEFVALYFGEAITIILIFRLLGAQSEATVLNFLAFPYLIWAAMRFGPPGACGASVVLALFVLPDAVPIPWLADLSRPTTIAQVLALQGFIIIASLTAMITAAVYRERLDAEGALRISQARYDLAADAGAVGVWDYDLRSRQLYVDAHLKEMLGYSEDDLGNDLSSWMSLMTETGRDEVNKGVEELLQGRQSRFEVEFPVRHRDGSSRYFLARGTIVRDETGGASRIVGTSSDITRLKDIENQLIVARNDLETRVLSRTLELRSTVQKLEHEVVERREVEERFRLAARATRDAIYDFDFRSGLVNQSEVHLENFGPVVGDAIDWWIDHLHPQDREQIAPRLRSLASAEEDSWTGEYRFRRVDGTYADVIDRGFIVRSADGMRVRMVGALTDVTDLKRRAEQARRDENLVSLGTFVAGIAHEINNPVAAIMMAAHVAKSELDKPEGSGTVRAMLEQISEASDRCARIVRSVLKFSRQEKSERWAVPLHELLVRSRDLALTQFTGKSLRIVLDESDPLHRVIVNPIEIQQVVHNLVTNAHQAGATEILIRTEPDGQRSCLYVSVIDNGCGMSPEQVQRSVDPFYTTRELEGGSGLGLSICHGIITSLGGKLEIHSTPDSGTTIRFDLPMETDRRTDVPDSSKVQQAAG
jgi:PAS domain S-box-containing protein